MHWLQGALVVALVAFVGALAAVQVILAQRLHERQVQRQALLDRTAHALIEQTVQGAALGAVSVLGLTEPLLKQVALGLLEPDAPAVLAPLSAARSRFAAQGVYVIAADGTIVAHATDGAHSTGNNVAFRPYFQQAMKGSSSVYAAVGAFTFERGLYVAAPLFSGSSPESSVVGAVMFKLQFAPIDALLANTGIPALLLSPQGVAYASTRPEWLYAVSPPLVQSRIDAIAALRQFGRHFDNGVASALPFEAVAGDVLIDGAQHAVERQEIDWNDPAGPWALLMLDDVSQAMPLADRLSHGGAVFVLLGLLGLLLMELLRNRQRMAVTQQRLQVLGAALESSPLAVVVTDAHGVIEWVNPEFERNTGYRLQEVRGRKP
jgi:two-component system sensor histidine kinase/response regulator